MAPKPGDGAQSSPVHGDPTSRAVRNSSPPKPADATKLCTTQQGGDELNDSPPGDVTKISPVHHRREDNEEESGGRTAAIAAAVASAVASVVGAAAGATVDAATAVSRVFEALTAFALVVSSLPSGLD